MSMTSKITFARVSGYDAAIAAAAHADVHVLGADGEIGLDELTEIGDEIVRLACAGKRNVVLDLSAVVHLDYRGVRPLVARARFLRSAGGDLKLCGLSHYLKAIFRAAGMWNEFDIAEDVETASMSFAGALID